MTKNMTSHTLEETYRIAAMLARTLTPGSIVALSGDLGAGKTTLVRGIVHALHGGAREVTSPTFTLMNVYEGHPPIYHFDWYRLNSRDALDTIGFEEYLEGPGISIIEWAEKFPEALPATTRWVTIMLDVNGTRHFSGVSLDL